MSQHPKDGGEEATGRWKVVRALGFSIEIDEK